MSSIFTGVKITHVYFWQYFACLSEKWLPSSLRHGTRIKFVALLRRLASAPATTAVVT